MKYLRRYLIVWAALLLAAHDSNPFGAAAEYSDLAPSGISVVMPSNAPSITQQFRRRSSDPALRNSTSDHLGIDIIGPIGTPVIAAAAGRVVRAFAGVAYGNQIVIDHGPDAAGRALTTRYLHLQSRLVQVGEAVRCGQQIATLGSTGVLAAGLAHLHFETHTGARVGPILAADPHVFWLGGVGRVTCFEGDVLRESTGVGITYPVVCAATLKSGN